MDRITESLLNEFSAEHGLSTLAESKRYEHFTSYIVVKEEHSETFDTHDIVVGDGPQTAGGSDFGIDAIAIIANGVLITDVDDLETYIDKAGHLEVSFTFVQSETSSGFDASKIGTFGFGVGDFFNDAPQLQPNSRVAGARDVMQAIYKLSTKFKRGNPICKLYYVTTGKWQGDPTLIARMDAVKSDLMETGLFRKVEFACLGAEGVQRLYQKTKNAISAEFNFANRVTISPEIPRIDEAYFGFLPWSEFQKLIIDEHGNMIGGLFFDNVRDWQGFNEVNSKIKSTLESTDRSRFVLMNNGLTIIAKSVQKTANKFLVEDYQIVNGCQTTHVLYEQRASLDDTVTIPVRLISTKDESVTNSIVKANNWQTHVKEEQLFALQEFPKILEAYFESYPPADRLYFERRSKQYDAASIEKTRIVTFDGMIRAFAAMFLNEPHRTTRNFKALKEKLGNDIFAEGQRMEPYYASALALYKIDFLFRNEKLEPKYKPARYQIAFAIRILIAGYEMPALGANKMESYCKKITDALLDAAKAEYYIGRGAKIAELASNGDFSRDSIRTEPFTKEVEIQAKAEFAKQS